MAEPAPSITPGVPGNAITASDISCMLAVRGEAETPQELQKSLAHYAASLNLYILQTALGPYNGEHTERDLDGVIRRLDSQPIQQSITELKAMTEHNKEMQKAMVKPTAEQGTGNSHTDPLFNAIAQIVSEETKFSVFLAMFVLLERAVNIKATISDLRQIITTMAASPSTLSISSMTERVIELNELLPSLVSARRLYELGYLSSIIGPLRTYNEMLARRVAAKALPGAPPLNQLRDYSDLPIKDAIDILDLEVISIAHTLIDQNARQSVGSSSSESQARPTRAVVLRRRRDAGSSIKDFVGASKRFE